MAAPNNPKMFHIVHVDHLASIVRDGALFSDAIMSRRDDSYGTKIGMDHIKQRRMKTPIGDGAIGMVGEYVPFYFCPRSVMLYILHRGNHNDISYRGGQEPIIHLVSDVNRAISWADSQNKRWAFSNTNAGAGYAEFFYDKSSLDILRWDMIRLNDFRPQEVKEAKQSEFLVRDEFNWELVTEVAVYSEKVKRQVEAVIEGAKHKPIVVVRKEWYY